MSRPALAELRTALREDVLDREWRSVAVCCAGLGLGHGGLDWYRVALVLERMTTDGEAEIRRPGARTRRYRRPLAAVAGEGFEF